MIARDTLGTEAEWKLYGTGPAIVDAFEKNEIDLAYIGLPPAVIGIDRGVEIKCVAGGHVEGTVISGRGLIKGFPEIGDLHGILKQCSGHTIGVPGKGSIHDVIISESLKRLHLESEIDVINFKWADQILEAIHRGQVTAAAGTPALAAAVMSYANGRILYPPSRLWPNNPSYGILVKTQFLSKEREQVERFLGLHEDAASFLRARPAEAARIIFDYIRIADEDFIMDTLKISPKYCAALTDDYISSTMQFVSVLKDLGYIGREIKSAEIFDTSLIDKIHPSKNHYEAGIAAD
jgi:NitT/TauT family transport system substrate-binding protein